jgi:hypothetical protein
MSGLVTFLIALLRALLPALVQYAKPSSEEGARAPELRLKLLERIRGTWGQAGAFILLLACLGGCTTHSVYVPDGTPVRLRETIKDAKVWVLNAEGEPVASKMNLPEGWYVLPMPEDNIDSD